MERNKKFPGMKLTEPPLYTRLRLDAARTGNEQIKTQVEALRGASRLRISQAQFILSEILHDVESYDLEKVTL